jgi:NAD(P)H-dependent flavin oxidoreductase YrpB (nitropropane dioxygenase family)
VKENIAHQNYKQAILDAGDTDTLITCRSFAPTRSLKTDFAKTLIELEKSGATIEAMQDYIGYRSNRTAQIEGDLNGGEAYSGASAGLIKEILPVKEVIRRLLEGFETVLNQLTLP